MFVELWAAIMIAGLAMVTVWALQHRLPRTPSSVAPGPVWIGCGVVIVALIALCLAAAVSNLAGSGPVNVTGDVLALILAGLCLFLFVLGLRRHSVRR